MALSLVWPLSAQAQDPAPAEIVILGEVHDNPEAHLGQADALRSLQPTAVVFEMLSPEAGEKANTARHRIEEVTGWATSGWPDFDLYRPVFSALGEAQIIGAAPSRDTVRAAFAQGALAVFGPSGDSFGLDQTLDEDERAVREEMQYQAHCQAMPREMMSGMVEAQRLRDATFARAALDALDAYGPPVAVIVGNGHARTDWGVPAMIAQAAPAVTVFSLAFAEADPDAPFDSVRLVPAPDRTDPCAVFADS